MISKIIAAIEAEVKSGKVVEPFSVKDFPNILKRSPSFLSKHCRGNPGGYTAYFERMGHGKYRLLRNSS